jgi:hypothetical protein
MLHHSQGNPIVRTRDGAQIFTSLANQSFKTREPFSGATEPFLCVLEWLVKGMIDTYTTNFEVKERIMAPGLDLL